MLFVILGLIVLFISFVVALVSLLRESRKNWRETEKTQDAKGTPFRSAKQNIEEQAPLRPFDSAQGFVEQAEGKAIGDEYVPFPWEQQAQKVEEPQIKATSGNLSGEISLKELRGE